MILEKIKKPNDIHKIPLEDFEPLAAEIRDFLIRSVSLLIPSSPAARHTANTRYGFAAASGLLSSILVSIPLDPGILTSEFWLFFFQD